ncbi:Cloroperoxidase [Tothia fuscella]|uniref:Cloroperoxidase n=1 Tax=Tothia fuscella TaxID=1048955 RepID=A0A9P4NYL9_9PEZI|nr:Cloroperoxidase [Tothia fuscella]
MKVSLLFSLSLLTTALAIPFHALELEPRGNPAKVSGAPDPVPTLNPVGKSHSSVLVHPWIPASAIKNSSRSPCPLLNTLANHGYLDRSGRRLKKSDFETGLVQGINLELTFAAALTDNAFFKLADNYGFNPEDPRANLDLEQLNVPNETEHDQSMTRKDVIQGDTLHQQPKMIAQVLGDSTPPSYPYLNTSSFGRTRLRRANESLAIGSRPLRPEEVASCNGEAALVVILLGETRRRNSESDDWLVKKERAGMWFSDERFPWGWKRSSVPITLGMMNEFAGRIVFWQNYWKGLDCGLGSGKGETLPLGKC